MSSASKVYTTPFKAVSAAVGTAEVARRYTHLEEFGGRAWYTARCPLPDHPDQDPSFYIYPANNQPGGRWYCYGCSRSGDAIDLEFFCGDYGELYEAMLELAYEFDVKLPEPSPGRREWLSEKGRRLDGMRDVLAASYQRRMFRLFRAYLESLEPGSEREEEARAIWDDLQPAAWAAAEWRASRREAR